jgi:hypothetical protein
VRTRTDILKELKNYIEFDNTEILSWLSGIAEDAFLHKTDEGYVGSIFIYHQLAENLLINLIKKSNLFVQASIYPHRIPNVTLKQQGDMKFSQICKMLNQHGVEFPEKQKIIQLATAINKVRNDFAHKISVSDKIYSAEKYAKECKRDFKLLFKARSKAIVFFYTSFSNLHTKIKAQEK